MKKEYIEPEIHVQILADEALLDINSEVHSDEEVPGSGALSKEYDFEFEDEEF